MSSSSPSRGHRLWFPFLVLVLATGGFYVLNTTAELERNLKSWFSSGIVLISGQFTPTSLVYAILAVPLVFLVTRGNRRYPLKLSSVAVSRLAAGLLLMAGVGLIASAL